MVSTRCYPLHHPGSSSSSSSVRQLWTALPGSKTKRNKPVSIASRHHDRGLGHPALFGEPPSQWSISTALLQPFGLPLTRCRTATKADIEAHFANHGTGEITEVKLMNGFGFIEYKDPMDARDVVPGKLSLPPAA